MPRRYVDRASALRSVAKRPTPASDWRPNLRQHGTTIPHSWKLEYAGNCTAPVYVFRDGVRLTKGSNTHIFGPRPLERPVMTEIEAPCRKCDNCLRRRAAHWRFRALSETKRSARTWFGTWTLSPEQHFRVATACRAVASKNGDDFDTMSPDKQFAMRHACINREITLYLKRIRKYSGADTRFMCVVEAHESGLPHYHVLLHEVDPAHPLRHKLLTEQWRVGFSNMKLVDESLRAAHYVCKYLNKSAMARVRASLHYGKQHDLTS